MEKIGLVVTGIFNYIMHLKLINYFTCGYTVGSRIYYFFTNWWQNPYKKVRSQIPRYEWKDRDMILQDVMFELFLGFIQEENILWQLDSCPDRLKDFEWLNWYLTKERPSLSKDVADGDSPRWHKSFSELEEQDVIAEELIFKWRKSLWT